MGQANSRSARPPLSSSSASPPASASASPSRQSSIPNPPPQEPPDLHPAPTPTQTAKPPRASFRRTVRGLLPHPRSTPQDPSSPSHATPSLRKRWRSSGRFSKPPSSLPDVAETHNDHSPLSIRPAATPDSSSPIPHEQPISEDLTIAVPVPSLSSPAMPPSVVPQPLPPPPSTCVSPQSLSTISSRLDQSQVDQTDVPVLVNGLQEPSSTPPSIPGHERSEHAEQQIEQDNDDFLSDQKQDEVFVEGSSQDGQALHVPELQRDPTTIEPHHEPASDVPPQPPRHFQPPGPLVVVQGVVNTSENPAATQTVPSSRTSRPSSTVHPTNTLAGRRSSSTPRPGLPAEERHSARSRLSAFIPRPSSMLSRRPSTPDRDSLPSHESESFIDASTSLQDISGPNPSSNLDDDSAAPSDPGHRLSTDSNARPRPLSPGSIDVLGTLLSVAAAATAASLFSPSLGFHVNADNNNPPSAGIPRPMSPTPTAGLGGEGLNSLSGFGLDPPAALHHPSSMTPPQPRDGRERIRNVWDSFRERLGLNRNPSASHSNDDAPTNVEEQNNMRPGEVMLAEMARALNIGLGLNGDGSSANPSAQSPEQQTGDPDGDGPRSVDDATPVRPPPPEDSFERFLLNLQADLRTALSDDNAITPSAPVAADVDEEHTSPAPSEDTASSRLPLFDELPIGIAGDNEDYGPPSLQELSDSEDDGEEDGVSFGERTSTRTPTPMPSATANVPPNRVDHALSSLGSTVSTTQEEPGNAERGPPGINLWRLYRFQPIPADQIAGHVANTTSPAPAVPLSRDASVPVSSPATFDTDTPRQSASVELSRPPPTTSVPSNANTPAAAPPAGDLAATSSNMVVPVIVVGLQSVDMGQAHGHARSDSDSVPPSDVNEWDRRSASYEDSQHMTTPVDGSATPRGRSWQSRAATALRNLRPGRRNGSTGRRGGDSAGSRTFLIYVIGGYYPPNHHMVTGSDNLDSYEALWELAELLGQVKPPVATREDIDKSGLQIIKSTELEWYEQQGKVASNCLDRCLICLDDYGSEDELRLMTCKHAFHKDCVDKWLQVGRNNCPACRTKGVSTVGDAAH